MAGCGHCLSSGGGAARCSPCTSSGVAYLDLAKPRGSTSRSAVPARSSGGSSGLRSSHFARGHLPEVAGQQQRYVLLTPTTLSLAQVFVRDFVPSALAFLMNNETDIVKNFLLKLLHLQISEKMVDRFKLGAGAMPASFKVDRNKNRSTMLRRSRSGGPP